MDMRILLIWIGFIVTLTGCLQPSNQHIDWVNFVQLNGIRYMEHTQVGRELRESDLGSEFARVKFKLEGNVNDSDYKTKDGDAAFLAEGTPVYTVKGYKPGFRLAAHWRGSLVLFEADRNPDAKKGSDLLDLAGKVDYIGINSEQDGKTELASVKDSKAVVRLVQMVLDAPIVEEFGEGGSQRYFIAFHFKDGTALSRSYWPESGELSRGILLPLEFRGAVEEALQAKPEPSKEILSSEGAEAMIAKKAEETISAIKNKNMEKLSSFIHPDKGVRFSPYSYVNLETDLMFKSGQLMNSFADQKEYTWGSYDGSGEPIRLTFAAYFNHFVYDQDYSRAEEIGYNRIIGKGNTINNNLEAYPGSIIVEYHFSGFDSKYEGMDWKSLRLVFEEKEGEWYLVGIIHDQWTI
jgi:hypothetical protein